MTYEQSGPFRIIINHTEISVVLKGKGAGKQLVRAGVEYAREHQSHKIDCKSSHE